MAASSGWQWSPQIPMTTYDEQKEAWFQAIGEFVVEFEHVCQSLRVFIIHDLKGNQTKSVTLMSALSARQLIDAVSSLLVRGSKMPEKTRGILKRVEDLNAMRNRIVHTPWVIGWESADGKGPKNPWTVTAFKPAKSKNSPQAWADESLDLDDVKAGITEARELMELLFRLSK